MRLGKKKEKDSASDHVKSQSVEGITRLICLSKAQTPLRGKAVKGYSSTLKAHFKFNLTFQS